ncbi:hypothetical protein QMK19_21400 [Streptomyces sp. H10-C2]|uniref:SRPBCC family protein n=1 Tax=unclassified Streptomyces TaxID=2593676 RepID=UPI0024B91C31|nr:MULTISPECIES: hypothetical protein [unclassified Streptomyces]MDJ0345396.1 hypothetical protein [Streptomyces sp. PH10-H1]MDJ0372150.1 hypothetical protein [Streptomyces sp. H10-C2]
MADIRHRVGISTPQARVHDALTTLDGLSGWWSRDVSGKPEPGGILEFRFGSPDRGFDMEVVRTADHQVAWRCVKGPEECGFVGEFGSHFSMTLGASC